MFEKIKYLLKTRVAKNLFWIFLGTGVGMLFGFISNIYLARILLPDGFGKIMYAQTWVQYLILITDFGLSFYAIREIAKRKDKFTEFVHNIIPLRFNASLILFVLFSFISWIAFPTFEMKFLVITSAMMIFVSALNTEWALQGLERMNLVGFSRTLINLMPLFLFFLFIKSPDNLLAVPVFRFLGSIVVVVFIFVFLKVKVNIFYFNSRIILTYLKASFYFWLLLLLVQVYHGADIIFLGIFRTPEEVGLYAAAFRLMNVFILGLGLINVAVFPVLSDYGVNDMRKFFVLKKAFLILSLLAGSLIVILFLLVGDKLILFLFGENYRGAIGFFKILTIGLAILMCNGPYSQSLLAKGYEKAVLLQASGCAIFNVLFNLIFIPRYGGFAAAVSYVITQFLSTIWLAIVYYRKIQPTYLSESGK